MHDPTPRVDKTPGRIRQMFGEIAPWYDFLNHFLSLNVDQRWRRRVVRLTASDLRSGHPILDVCTGTGDLALAYHRYCGAAVPIVACDFCHPMLVRATQKALRRGAAIPWIEADAQRLPFPANTFQLVTVAFGLRNISDFDQGIAEMVRVLQPGGRLAILEFATPRTLLLRQVYLAYFRYILPLIGQCLARNRHAAYRYLPESVLQFPEYEGLLQHLRRHGLVEEQYIPFSGGIAVLYLARKPTVSAPHVQLPAHSDAAPVGSCTTISSDFHH